MLLSDTLLSDTVPKTPAQLKKEAARLAKLEKFQKKQEALKVQQAAQVRTRRLSKLNRRTITIF